MAECQLPKLNTRVRFPSRAPSRGDEIDVTPIFFSIHAGFRAFQGRFFKVIPLFERETATERQCVTHSKGDLSYLSPLNTGCRREPESVFIIYFITHTRAGESQTAFSFPWPSITGMGGEINNLPAGGLLLDQSLQPFLRYYSAGWNSCSMELMRILAIVSSASFTAG